MKIVKTILLIVFATALVMPTQAKREKKEKEPVVTTVFVFGVSQDLADSTVYMTAIAPVNGVTLLPHNMLQYRQYYTEQMKTYVESTYGRQHQTTAFFFRKNRKDAEKAFEKVKAKLTKQSKSALTFKDIKSEDFHFKVPVLVSEDDNDF